VQAGADERDPEQEGTDQRVDQRHAPDEPRRADHVRQDLLFPALTRVQVADAAAGARQDRQHHDDDALTPDELHEVAPQVHAARHVVEVVGQRQADRGEPAHRLEVGVEVGRVVT
jgi:hypothetical protein